MTNFRLKISDCRLISDLRFQISDVNRFEKYLKSNICDPKFFLKSAIANLKLPLGTPNGY